MLYACKRSELHNFSSFRGIKTNTLLTRITYQQLYHFRHQWGVRKVGKRQFPTFVGFPVATLDRNNSRTGWPIQRYIYRCSSNLKLYYMIATCNSSFTLKQNLFTRLLCLKQSFAAIGHSGTSNSFTGMVYTE